MTAPRVLIIAPFPDRVVERAQKEFGAVVSQEHGNFIINDGKATARDVLELIALIQRRAREERDIELHTEVEIIGD